MAKTHTINIKHFHQLTADRKDSLRLLNKNSMRGIRDSVVEKYSEQAHFVYELLQNADDVQATTVRFILKKEGLYFIHNGKVPFTVTAPNVSPAGHINAITSIGASSKKGENYKIGKFGIGFKSVFQYTQTPYIYDVNIAFRIRDLIVPEYLEEQEHPLRKKGETLFYFPFNHENKTAREAEKEIGSRLRQLQMPLLFLNHLLEIQWETAEGTGYYKKRLKSKTENGLARLELLKQTHQKSSAVQLLKISQNEPQSQLPYSIVFVLDGEGKVDSSNSYPAHCYFPTRVATQLKFLIHAPFLLTDSREGIKFTHEWNRDLIRRLSRLLFDKIEALQEGGWLNEAFFQSLAYQQKNYQGEEQDFFSPFYQETYHFFRNTDVACFPSTAGTMVDAENAFIPSSDLSHLIDTERLTQLTGNPLAHWILSPSFFLSDAGIFIKNILVERAALENRISPLFDLAAALERMSPSFLEEQSDEWLLGLYQKIEEQNAYEKGRQLSLIRLENGEMVRPFAENGTPNAYLPTSLDTDYPLVKSSIAEQAVAWDFLEKIGLTTPELREELSQHVLPKYQRKGSTLPSIADIEKIYTHYQQCNSEEAEDFCHELKELPFLQAINANGELVAAKARELYFFTEDLSRYFEGNEDVLWLPLEELYAGLLAKIDKGRFKRFLLKIGVNERPRLLKTDDSLTEAERKELMQQQTPHAAYPMWEEVEDVEMEGLAFFLQHITAERSRFLWHFLNRICNKKMPPQEGLYKYEYEDEHQVRMPAHWLRLLRDTAWLMDVDGQFLPASQLKPQWMDLGYGQVQNQALAALLFQVQPEERLQSLTDEERMAMELGQRLLQKGVTALDLQHFQAWKDQQEKRERQKQKWERKPQKRKEPQDVDEFNPAFLSSEELMLKKQALRQQMEADLIEQLTILEKIEALKNAISEAENYTFAWFNALLELEYIFALEQMGKDRSLHIVFKELRQEQNTSKTILLQKPNKDIPHSIEMMGDMTLKIQLEEERKSLAVEVVSIKKGVLRAKLKSPEEIVGVDLAAVREGVLEIKNTIFTLESLVRAFQEMDFSPTDNLQTQLPENIRFVFGPPGTGKTTHLATKEILPTMLGEQPKRILVLTPTNKSADVLAKKLLPLHEQLSHGLLRLGTAGDDAVENAGVLCDSTLDFSEYERCCVITTATRFPYDGFNNGMRAAQLKNIDWDMVIIDEASMVSLAMTTFILHQLPKAEIIIAGDPFQIEPIVYAEEWKGQNIYTLVNLNSFSPDTQSKNLIPRNYPVLNLTTQYRSVPEVGRVFSNFTYENRLSHFKKQTEQRPLDAGSLSLKSVNIIRFPVHKLETLYRPQKLKGSHYHIYAAILTAELIKYLVHTIFENHIRNNKNEPKWQIGVICPYKAQAQLVDKIIAAQHIFKPKIKVKCGTIHSFQGDECDIMINLYNPPLHISRSPNMFLNKRNIINVGISRAKHYLILLLPNNETEGADNLYELSTLLSIIYHELKGKYMEMSSDELENRLFRQKNYIESNTFATTHQSINVYTEPEKQFEIRVEEIAVDVQVKNQAK